MAPDAGGGAAAVCRQRGGDDCTRMNVDTLAARDDTQEAAAGRARRT
jgi:hypothetical protein